ILRDAERHPDRAWVVLKKVHDPSRYGVVEMADGRVVSIEEKPKRPRSDFAVTGIYVYPPDVFDVIKHLRPSQRGELEITEVNQFYLREGRLGYSFFEGYWNDAGTLDSLDYSNELVRKSFPRFEEQGPALRAA